MTRQPSGASRAKASYTRTSARREGSARTFGFNCSGNIRAMPLALAGQSYHERDGGRSPRLALTRQSPPGGGLRHRAGGAGGRALRDAVTLLGRLRRLDDFGLDGELHGVADE